MDENNLKTANLILDILEEMENFLSKYYGLCALTFPEDRDLWEDISQDETIHAQFVVNMRKILMNNPDVFEMGKTNLAVMKTYRKGIEDQFLRLKEGKILRRNSFFIARDLENSLMEHRFYEVLKGGNPEYQKMKNLIIEETENHYQKIDAYIKEKL